MPEDLGRWVRRIENEEAPDLSTRIRGGQPKGEGIPRAPRGTRAGRGVAVTLVTVLVAAGIILPLKAMLPLAGHDKIPGGSPDIGSTNMIALWPEQTQAMADDAAAKAAAGDPDYTWQLDPKQVALRFATDVLGWPDTPSNPLSVGFHAIGSEIATVSGPAPPCPSPGCPPGTQKQVAVYLGHPDTQPSSRIWLVTLVSDSVFTLRPNGGPPVHSGDTIRIPTEFPDGTSLWAGITYGWCGGQEWGQPVTVQGGEVAFVAGSGTEHQVKPSGKDCAGAAASPSAEPSGFNAYVWVTRLSSEQPIPFQLWQFLGTKFPRATMEGIGGPTLTSFSASPIQYVPTTASDSGQSSTGPGTIPPDSVAALRDYALQMAANNGDPSPTAVQAVVTTLGQVKAVLQWGDNRPASEPVILVQITGDFTCNTCKVLSNANIPKGSAMWFLTPAKRPVPLPPTDWGVEPQPIDLTRLGSVVDLTSAQVPPATFSTQVDHLTCTATLGSTVRPGERLDSAFIVTNETGGPQQVLVGNHGMAGNLRFYDSTGNLIADTADIEMGMSGPPPGTQSLEPGGSMSIPTTDVPVVWSGPLKVVPVCGRRPMTSLDQAATVSVADTGPAPPPQVANTRAIAATGGIFDNCRPMPGKPATGTVTKKDRSMSARCEVLVEAHPGFDVVTLAAINPPNSPPVDIKTISVELGPLAGMSDLPVGTSMSWWTFVVTPDRTTLTQSRSAIHCVNSEGGGNGLVTC